MRHRFETADGDYTVIVSEQNIKLLKGRELTFVSLPPAEDACEKKPFDGDIYFEDGKKATYLQVRGEIFLHYEGETWSFRRKERELSLIADLSPEIKSPMPGKIIQMFAELGKTFEIGETILIVEAMKMENAIKAPFACTVREILKREGEIVQQDEPIVILDKKSFEKT